MNQGRTMYKMKIAVLACLCVPSFASHAALFQPDSATASSEFDNRYDIGNTIDASALPSNFTPLSAHGDYQVDNHWTTKANETIGEFADFNFDTPVTIGTFHMWNHRSTTSTIASNDLYEVTLFDLQLFDSNDQQLFELLGVTAVGETAVAQSYGFSPVNGVSRVRFTVRNTQGDQQGIGTRYTGLAEVAFEPTNVVPTPSAAALLAPGLALLTSRRRTRRA